MTDVTIVGTGAAARACGDVLARAGFSVTRAFEIEAGENSAVILGDIQGGFQLAREAVQTGRNILIATQQALTPERLSMLLEDRKRAQAIFVWSESRYHPGYRFVSGLIESDSSWRPRYVRLDRLNTEAPSSGLMRWQLLDMLALAGALSGEAPQAVSAAAARSPQRGCPDLVEAGIECAGLQVFLRAGLGEPVERRETLLAAQTRKLFIDELNPSTPVRLATDEPGSGGARWLSCPAPSSEDLARQQCVAFLDATLDSRRAREEASLWLRSLAALEAIERSLQTLGAPAGVDLSATESRFRLIPGRLRSIPPSVA